jgi:hypothetical protein
MAPPLPEDQHEWLSFDDPDEDRTWMFDVTFLLSNWSCIYGRGCQGILTGPAPELSQGCCSYGAHLVDDEDLQTVTAAVARLTDANWQHRRKGQRSGWHQRNDEGETVTRLVNDVCIFHNGPGFEGGTGCAFHIAAAEAGERHIDWKPDVCWQVPLRLDNSSDGYGHVTSLLREWKRRDWGEGGFEFHWWCTDAADAFVGKAPVYEYLREEIVELVGRSIYDLLVVQLTRRAKKSFLPHPAVRR